MKTEFWLETGMSQAKFDMVTNWVEDEKSSYCEDSGPTGLLGLRNTATWWSQLTSAGGVSQLGTHSCGLEHSWQEVTILHSTTDESMVKLRNEYKGKIVDDGQAVDLEQRANHFGD